MKFIQIIFVLFSGFVLHPGNSIANNKNRPGADPEQPNILWLTSEDNSPWLGCYGDQLATSPFLDKLASEGFMYTHAYANAPVCAPSRNTIITGVYGSSAGNDNMRSNYSKSDIVKLLPEYLKSKGYYCTNNDKKDYNIGGLIGEVWDESSSKAHYKNRKPGQPFFAVFNTLITHESCLHKKDSGQELKHDPAAVSLAPYHPDTKEMRRDYARFYDAIENMDSWVGNKLKELAEAGLLENTIVIYYGDHGGILGRSKRFLYETGTRIPLIIRIPPKFKKLYPAATPGSSVSRLVSLVDLVPTMLSITGIPIPGYLQGSAFLGTQKTASPPYVHMFRGRMDERIDMSRAVRDERFRYVRNYMPYRPYAQYIDYLWKAPSMRSWEQAYLNGSCSEVQSRFFHKKPVEELYDTEHDPWEVNNLAANPAYRDILLKMRNENTRWMKLTLDAGFIPEGIKQELSEKTAIYDYMRLKKVPVDEWIAVSDLASYAVEKDIPLLKRYLSHPDSVVRYWAANGLLQLGSKAETAVPALMQALKDSCDEVALTAAEALYSLGHKQQSLFVLLNGIASKNSMVQLHAFNSIDNVCKDDTIAKQAVNVLVNSSGVKTSEYVRNLTKSILAGSAVESN